MSETLNADPAGRGRTSVVRSRALTVGLVLGLVLLLCVATWWRLSPDVFHEIGPGESVEMSGDAKVGQTFHFDMAYPRKEAWGREPVRTHRTEAKVVVNSAEAEVSFALCTIDLDEMGGAFMSARGSLDRWCRELGPVEDGLLDPNPKVAQQLVMTVRPSRPGVVKIAGVDLKYSSGWQRGTQTTGSVVRLRVK